MALGKQLARHVVEILSGIVLTAGGVAVQVIGNAGKKPQVGLVVAGGVFVAFGGVLLSWIAARLLAANQAADAAVVAADEVGEKLDNLSRVLGQAAGQISQAVEQVDLGQTPPETGFALVSQATRMIYGQVNEIAVIRGASFDSAYLIETAGKLDQLARELTGGTAAESYAVELVRQQLKDVQEDLSSVSSRDQRTLIDVNVRCPYCAAENVVRLGSIPGDTATYTCTACSEIFNSHRAANGTAFSRPRTKAVGTLPHEPEQEGPAPDPPKWQFACPECSSPLRAPTSASGERLMVCPTCFSGLQVDAHARSVRQDGVLRQQKAQAFTRRGSRPQTSCPDCGRPVNAHLISAQGYFGYCPEDRVALIVDVEEFNRFVAKEATDAER